MPKQKESQENMFAKKAANVYKNSPDYQQSYLKQLTDSSQVRFKRKIKELETLPTVRKEYQSVALATPVKDHLK